MIKPAVPILKQPLFFKKIEKNLKTPQPFLHFMCLYVRRLNGKAGKRKRKIHMYCKNEPDETLVMLTLAGEQTAYEVLVRRYQSAVVSAALSVTKTNFMAEDAAQDAFVTAWMKLDTLQQPGRFGIWVCRIARNCALNMINRYRSYLPLEAVENTGAGHEASVNPEELCLLSEERKEINESVDRLPEKVRQIIRLHYFEDLSISEIADRMRISEGTVKWQLHEGRKKIRKELCAMNEKYSDTLVERVMKKVEELKLWQLRNDKSGFEKVYREVLKEIEELPECADRHHAMADVLMRGWWWLPGDKNDALFARIADAAIKGRNEEVMTFIVSREDSQLEESDSKVDFIRDTQIPRLEKAGFVKALGAEWFCLGYNLFRAGKADEGEAAYKQAENILGRGDKFREMIPYARKFEKKLDSLKDVPPYRYMVSCAAYDLRVIDGSLRFWSEEGHTEGWLVSFESMSRAIIRNASRCDGMFTADIPAGGKFEGSDGTVLRRVSDCETVSTPAGVFDGCVLWETEEIIDYIFKKIFRTYYKDGTGIVRQDVIVDGVCSTGLLCGYEIKGGKGMIPLCEGNRWEYSFGYPRECLESEFELAVTYFDGSWAVIARSDMAHRMKYDENSWVEAVQEIAQEYCPESENGFKLCDVYPAIGRAERLAVTPMEKAHAKAAAAVARRILETDPTFNPDFTAEGYWNFFNRNLIVKNKESLKMTNYNCRWSFEWKRWIREESEPLLFNDIFGILMDATNAIWSDEWRAGASPVVEFPRYYFDIRTQITCEEGGTVTTKAGTFENCLKVRLDISGPKDGLSYRGGKKTYWFADGVGIVRTENEYCGGHKTAVYELTSYEGTGEGYMPVGDGFFRRYDAVGLTDGFVGYSEYSFVADGYGDIVVFSDRCGIRQTVPPVSNYGYIQGEIEEERLWSEQGRLDESRILHGINNFELLCHFFGRDSRHLGAEKLAAEWFMYKIRMMETLDSSGCVPDAWLGNYACTCFMAANALFGCGRTDEGYQWLDKAFEIFPKWDSIPDGTEMRTGDPLIFGGVKIIKGKPLQVMPDGEKKYVRYHWLFEETGRLLYDGMTAPRGWEWFDPVRNEERFREYIERARKLAGIKEE